MSEEQDGRIKEMQRTIRLLERMRSLAQEASMTGALRKAGHYAAQQYNGLVGLLTRQGVIIPEYFPPLDEEESSMDSVGFAAAQLAEYLRSEFPEAAGEVEGGMLNQFFGARDLRHIGDVIREAMPEWMRSGREGPGPQWRHRHGPAEPGPPNEPSAAAAEPPGELERRLAEVAARMEEVSAQMRQEGLPAEELRRHAAELARLAQEQAQISQAAAGRRGRSAER
jgi:hypothetical protein